MTEELNTKNDIILVNDDFPNNDKIYETYEIKTNINKKLSNELGLDEKSYDEDTSYDPPKEYGLDNCNVIIPPYYHLHKNPSKILNID
jgi:hypothetical protein